MEPEKEKQSTKNKETATRANPMEYEDVSNKNN